MCADLKDRQKHFKEDNLVTRIVKNAPVDKILVLFVVSENDLYAKGEFENENREIAASSCRWSARR